MPKPTLWFLLVVVVLAGLSGHLCPGSEAASGKRESASASSGPSLAERVAQLVDLTSRRSTVVKLNGNKFK
jgi:hypothetical protein